MQLKSVFAASVLRLFPSIIFIFVDNSTIMGVLSDADDDDEKDADT